MTNFAQSVKKLLDSGIPNTVTPAAGMGLTLDQNGKLPATTGDAVFLRLIGDGVKRTVNGFLSSLTYPGGSPTSNTVNVAHGLGLAPAWAMVSSASGANHNMTMTDGGDATNLHVQARTVDGSSPAAATVAFFFWSAVA